MTKFFDIYIKPDTVLILEKRLTRPPYMSPSEWLDLWEEFKRLSEQPTTNDPLTHA